jgi:uncharacterized membrane protein YbhN (UPF0104 family)
MLMLLKRYGLLWLLIALFLWLVASRYSEIQQLATTLASGRWQWIIVAIMLTVILYVVRAALYQAVFYTVEVKSRIRDLLPLVFSSIFMNVAVPSGGVSSAALFIDDANHRGQSPARTAAGTVLFLVDDLIAFSVVLVACGFTCSPARPASTRSLGSSLVVIISKRQYSVGQAA